MSAKVVKSCCVCSNNESDNVDVSYHRFPTDPDLFRLWVEALPISNYSHEESFVCSKHFQPHEVSLSRVLDRNILRSHAVPSIFDLTDMKANESASVVAGSPSVTQFNGQNPSTTCTVSDSSLFKRPMLPTQSSNSSTFTMSDSLMSVPQLLQIKEESPQLIISPDTPDFLNTLKEEEISISSPVPWQEPTESHGEEHFTLNYDAQMSEQQPTVVFSDPKPQFTPINLQTRQGSKRRCCACPSTAEKRENRHLHRFPSNNKTREKWRTALKGQGIKISSLDSLYLCSEHFEEDPTYIDSNGPSAAINKSSSKRPRLNILNPKTINKSVESLLSAKVMVKRLDPRIASFMEKDRNKGSRGPNKIIQIRDKAHAKPSSTVNRTMDSMKKNCTPNIPSNLPSNVPLKTLPTVTPPQFFPNTSNVNRCYTKSDVFYVTRSQVLNADRVVFPLNGKMYTFYKNSVSESDYKKLESEKKKLEARLEDAEAAFKVNEYRHKTKAEQHVKLIKSLRLKQHTLVQGLTKVEEKICKMKLKGRGTEDELTPLMGNRESLAKDMFAKVISKLRNCVLKSYTQRILNFSMLLYHYSIDAYQLVREAFNGILPHHKTLEKNINNIAKGGVEKAVLFNMLKIVAENKFETTEEQFAHIHVDKEQPTPTHVDDEQPANIDRETQNQEVLLTVSNKNMPQPDSEILVTVDQGDLEYMHENTVGSVAKSVHHSANSFASVPSPIKKKSYRKKRTSAGSSNKDRRTTDSANYSKAIEESISKQVMFESTVANSSGFEDIGNSKQALNYPSNCSSLPYEIQTISSVNSNSVSSMVPFSPSTVFSLDSNRYIISSNDGILQSDGNILVPLVAVSSSSSEPSQSADMRTVPSLFPNIAPATDSNVYATSVALQPGNSFITTEQMRSNSNIVYPQMNMQQNIPQTEYYDSNLRIDESAPDVEMN